MKKRAILLLTLAMITGCAHKPSDPLVADPLMFGSTDPLFLLPEDGQLTLENAIYRSLANNRDLAIRKLEPALERTFLEIEEATFGTEFFGLVEYGEETSSETARSTGERFEVEADRRESEVGLRRDFSSGTDVSLSLQEIDESSNRAPTQQELRANLELTQSLLRGRGQEVNQVRIRQAELGVDISIEELRGYTQALIAETEISYWQLQLAREAVDITAQALEVAEQNLSEIQVRIEVGQLAKDEEIASLAEVSSRKQNQLNAKANLARRKLILERLLALDSGESARLQPVSELTVADQPLSDAAPLLDQAMNLNPSLREARIRLLQGELELVRTRNGLLPKLDFFADLSKTGYGEDFSSAGKNFSDNTYEWTAGVQVLQELGISENDADQKAALIEREQADLAVQNLEEKVANDIRLAIVEHNRALAQSAASRETKLLRQKTAEAEKARFDVGTSTSLLVAQAQREVLESQIDELEIRIAYRIALVRLQELTGQLLIRYGVEVE